MSGRKKLPPREKLKAIQVLVKTGLIEDFGLATLQKHAINGINENLLTDTQRIEAYYNKDKDTFTPISQISKKLQEDIRTILNRK